jgi:phospholipid transport system transporter-binding protein
MSVLMKSETARLEADDNTLKVSGRVAFEAAAEMAEAGRDWLASRRQGGTVRLDLSQVEGVSSTALSVMLEWLRSIGLANLSLEAVALSPALARLTQVAGIDTLLPSGN